jgi:hypothetical protein
MRACWMAALLLAGGASAALAQIAPAPPQAPKAIVQAQMGGPATGDKKGRPGVKAQPADSDKSASGVSDSLASCLAMWERATHMSRQEWARACQRVDDRLRSISVK